MTSTGYTLFDTAVGRCALVWGERGLLAVGLPEAHERATRSRIRKHFPDAAEAAPPPEVRETIDLIITLLRGEQADLSGVPVDMDRVPDFERRVYEAARTIPFGATMTYGEIATRMGDAGLARDVGQALGKNPFPIVVPCHRVLAAGRKLGGFSAYGGAATKHRLLTIEGAFAAQPSLFDDLPVASKPRRGKGRTS